MDRRLLLPIGIVLLLITILLGCTSPQQHVDRGNEFASQDRYDEAIQQYNKAIELDPNLAVAYYDRGSTYAIGLADYEQAISDYNKAIELDPNYTEAYGNRGNAYAELGQYQQAIADFSSAIELNPNDGDAYLFRGAVYAELGKIAEAIADLEKCVTLTYDPQIIEIAEQFIEGLGE